MKKILSLSILLTVLFTSACDHYSEKVATYQPATNTLVASSYHVNDIEPAAGGHAFSSGMTFKSHLKNEYMTLATYEETIRRDYTAAKYFSNKVERLEKGQLVAPATIRDFNIQPEQRAVFQEARQDLIDAIQVFNIPENRYVLAYAQSRYDCWMDQAEDRPDEAMNAPCRIEFEQTLDSVETDSIYYGDDDLFDLI